MMNGRALTRALNGRWHGSQGIARCPAHEDRTPSLSITDGTDGRLLIHCFAGCSFQLVRDALTQLGLDTDHRSPRSGMPAIRATPRQRHAAATPSLDDAERSERALALWDACRPASSSLVEIYLASRRLTLPPGDMIRFHPGLKHPSGSRWPAMVALVTRGLDHVPLGIHRTFLAHNGSGKAPVNPDKMMLGPTRGGVVRLAEADGLVMVGEGIETCLSVLQAMSDSPVWAALSTSGLRSLVLPVTVREVVILADRDDPGEAAAQAAAQRWRTEGRRVRIARPPLAGDFNDLLGVKSGMAKEVRG